jgi:hypothetical protein
VDPTTVKASWHRGGHTGGVGAWRRPGGGRGGHQRGAGVDPTAVGEAPVRTRRRWRRSRSGHAVDGKMKKLGFKGQSCNLKEE